MTRQQFNRLKLTGETFDLELEQINDMIGLLKEAGKIPKDFILGRLQAFRFVYPRDVAVGSNKRRKLTIIGSSESDARDKLAEICLGLNDIDGLPIDAALFTLLSRKVLPTADELYPGGFSSTARPGTPSAQQGNREAAGEGTAKRSPHGR